MLIAVRVVIGCGSVFLGLYLGTRSAFEYAARWNVLLCAGVVIIGGVIVLARVRQRLPPSRKHWIAGTAVAVIGLLVSAFTPVSQTCCETVWIISLGLPLPWTTGHGDTWAQAFDEAWRGTSVSEPVSAIANVIFWGYAGMIATLGLGVNRRAKHRSVDARP
ncbi:hypothetical protein AB0M36_24330 [Actinoplanes sp. NPDC051346]|uniref:hypothetical protein n=1 Tax=Actinoplanes sp. NPDC051346 TaxID=3155048 RepID=UPI00341C47C3